MAGKDVVVAKFEYARAEVLRWGQLGEGLELDQYKVATVNRWMEERDSESNCTRFCRTECLIQKPCLDWPCRCTLLRSCWRSCPRTGLRRSRHRSSSRFFALSPRGPARACPPPIRSACRHNLSFTCDFCAVVQCTPRPPNTLVHTSTRTPHAPLDRQGRGRRCCNRTGCQPTTSKLVLRHSCGACAIVVVMGEKEAAEKEGWGGRPA